MMTTIRMNQETTRFPIDPYYTNFSSSSSSESLARMNTQNDNGLPHSFQRLSVTYPPPISPPSTSDQSSSRCSASRCRPHSYNMADPLDVQRVRAETKQLLILCLQAQCNSNTTNDINTKSRSGVESLAGHLEQALFDMAPTLPDYSNVHTLPLRLSLILPRVKKQWIKKHPRRRSHPSMSSNSQPCLLAQQLGEDQYQSIQRLVETIRLERNQLVGASCAKCQRIQRATSGEVTAIPTNFGSKLDTPVSNLFFHTPLVAAWEKNLTDRGNNNNSQILPVESWNRLQAQAQQNLDAFWEWKALNFVCFRK